MTTRVTFGECPVCRQGTLEAARLPNAGVLVVVCDDCESQWRHPGEATGGDTVIREEYARLVPADAEEVAAAGWPEGTVVDTP
ncbi:hypothetical protein G6O69_01010 [Pseudenhygromyxa sp. WMMC2535]|uniref:hypothetical protein n=1 Tax=Pseudenhygromyxa sp. WMMC2535 TaxID=2712867 RepID=UPI0015569309|nr:hypothetical protein [Pseudenhygromyxa sp. WMMC2535]NVB36390.1 hypothetical protein [Pseudenhygromyxa sp. WMMC2535]